MQLVTTKDNLLVSLFLGLLAALIAIALASSTASASPFCGGASVNNANKCWGNTRALSGATAYGTSTGVCVGADLTQGTCAPTGQLASVDEDLTGRALVEPGVHAIGWHAHPVRDADVGRRETE